MNGASDRGCKTRLYKLVAADIRALWCHIMCVLFSGAPTRMCTPTHPIRPSGGHLLFHKVREWLGTQASSASVHVHSSSPHTCTLMHVGTTGYGPRELNAFHYETARTVVLPPALPSNPFR